MSLSDQSLRSVIMDAHDLSTLLHMQNRTQQLLEKLQTNQSLCHQLLDTSLSSISSASLDSSQERNKRKSQVVQSGWSDRQLLDHSCQERPSQQPRAALASRIQKQKLLSHLQAKSKLENYKQVSDGQTPGNHPRPRLKQGIENNRYLFGDLSTSDNIVKVCNNTERELSNSQTDKKNVHEYSLEGDELSDQDHINSSVTFQDELELLGSGITSIPGTPKKAGNSMSETPRSILKQRKIISDNVRVDSEYAHTPIKLVTPKSKHGLNYSYSSITDSASSSKLTDHGRKSVVPKALNGAYTEECLGKQNCTDDKTIDDNNESVSDVDKLIKERLLLDDGNDRKNAILVQDLSKRPKSYIFSSVDDVDDIQGKQVKSPKTQKATQRIPAVSASSKLWRSRDMPLLGYDWIAGNLENESSLFDQPDEYFREIQEFRKKHKLTCAGKTWLSNGIDLTRPISPEVTDPGHKCLHGYTLNERLFTEPLNADYQGKSVCPVCLTSRKEPTEQSPGFVRVSIPRSTLDKPYRIKPRRRRSFDCTDSYALSQHCLAGYECSLPTTIPTARNVDIRGASGIKGKQAMTLQEAEDFVKSHSRKSCLLASQPSEDTSHNKTMSPLISGLTLASDSFTRQVDVSSRSVAKDQTTDTLLNISHNLRYDLQDLARRTGRDKHKIPHSTNYPVL